MARLRKTSTILSNLKIRHAIPVFAVAFALAGCSTLGRGDAKSLYELAKQMLNGNNVEVTLEEAASVPYASMGIRLGSSRQAMIVLAGNTGGQQLWTSSANIAVTTKAGRIVRTAGFPNNLGGFTPERNVGLERADGGTVRWQADFPDLQLYSVSISCRDKPAGDETIVILGSNIRTRRIEESCTSVDHSLEWSFHNTYWLDPASGLVWRSIQHVHPLLDAIETEILRPPA